MLKAILCHIISSRILQLIILLIVAMSGALYMGKDSQLLISGTVVGAIAAILDLRGVNQRGDRRDWFATLATEIERAITDWVFFRQELKSHHNILWYNDGTAALSILAADRRIFVRAYNEIVTNDRSAFRAVKSDRATIYYTFAYNGQQMLPIQA